MPKAKLMEYQRLLETAEKEASERLARERAGLSIESHGDDVDKLLESLDREQSITTSEQATLILRQVRAAVQRIEDGAFGECVRCGGDIAEKRLRAVPWTPHCLRCQEALDRRQWAESLSAA